jgi:hypothetical protein
MDAPSRDEVAELLRDVARAFRVWWPEDLYDVGQEKAGAMYDAIEALKGDADRVEDVKALRMALEAMVHITEVGRMPTVYLLEGMAVGVAAGWRSADGVPEWWKAFTASTKDAAAALVRDLAATDQPVSE